MNDWWFALDSYFSKADCLEILELYKNPQEGKVGFDQDKKVDFIRKSSIVGFAYNSSGWQRLSEMLDPIVMLANRECFGFDISGISEFQIASYKSSEYYKEHMDCKLRGVPSTRKLSVSVQLTDGTDYEGGDFVFGKDIPLLPFQVRDLGSVIVFPSFLYHQIQPVTKGKRFSLVGWYEGPQWK